MKGDQPQTLLEATRYFADLGRCIDYIVSRRWLNGVVCPTCGSRKVSFIKSVSRFQCSKAHSKRQFTVKTGSVLEDSPLSLEKWLIAMWLIANAKNGISSYEIHRALGVTQKTAWFMLHRIREAMRNGTLEKVSGEVESDETFIGGRELNKHKNKKTGPGGGWKGKAVVWGVLQRGGRVIARVVPDPYKRTLHSALFTHVDRGSVVYTDAHFAYKGISPFFQHEVVDHAYTYVQGLVHTNGIENFWSLLKRSLKGTYVSVEPFHLSRYLDEQVFRYNERKGDDGSRHQLVTKLTVGKRLTYRVLTGHEA